ncbi:hypothetical protein GCM10009710_02390 [Aeromicrobium alkaliterrae]|uniref:Uncharacterized protein n=2 Tax=Aeromicrobium alkaliterrae TaxID=302168 RepID=A0ABP4VJM6_9ACTN
MRAPVDRGYSSRDPLPLELEETPMNASHPDAGPGTDGTAPVDPKTSPDTEPDSDEPPTQPSPDASELDDDGRPAEPPEPASGSDRDGDERL